MMDSCASGSTDSPLSLQIDTMSFVVHYGLDHSAELDLDEAALVAACGTPQKEALADPEGEVEAALSSPLGFPPLSQATVAGDHVVLVLGHAVPQAAHAVAAAVRVLIEAGIEPEDITVLRTADDVEAGAENPCSRISEPIQQRIQLRTHDPTDRDEMAYLAATKSGEPVLLDRTITDADVVVPVGCLRSQTTPGYYGIYSTLFPAFSDQKTQKRYRGQVSHGRNRRQQRQLSEEVEEVGWLLGAAFAVQVVPGPRGQILDVVAGEVGSVGRRGQELYDAAWSWLVARQASLVVVSIEGGTVQQTWHNLGRALEVAAPLVEEGGAIAVCSSLAAAPGAGIRLLASAASRSEALLQIDNEPPEDVVPARQLAAAQERARVYLLSELEEALVEDLEMVPLGRPSELARLARQHASCLLLSNAPYAVVQVREEG